MAQYTCTNENCPTAGAVISLTSTGQTYCPNCYQSTLTPHVAALQRVVRFVNQLGDGMTAGNTNQKGECAELIAKFSLTRQSVDEAGTTSDYIVKLGTDKRKRIDRQGPVKTGNTVTHARFAVQLGGPVYAGIHMPVDEDFTIAQVRQAFTQSLANTRYVRLVVEWV